MFLCFRPILFLTFFNSLICVGSLIEKCYIQTIPGTKHHRFLVTLIFLLHLSFFGHKIRLRRGEHLQRKETHSCEPYFNSKVSLNLNNWNNPITKVNFTQVWRNKKVRAEARTQLLDNKTNHAAGRRLQEPHAIKLAVTHTTT